MLKRWSQPNGYREVLDIGLPLVVSMGSVTMMIFTDRVFLSQYSLDTIAAAVPAGFASFLFISFFMGVANYTNVFVAQYYGANKLEQVGSSVWQGIYFSFLAWLLLAGLSLAAPAMFRAVGHAAEVQRLEVAYFQILLWGSGLLVGNSALSSFYSGRGVTRTVMAVNVSMALFNIPLDYVLINGLEVGGRTWVPSMGITGAGLATVGGWSFATVLWCRLVFSSTHDKHFATWRNRRLEVRLFLRLLKYGVPGGVQFFLQMLAVTFFTLVVGRLDKNDLAATNIVLAIHSLALLPTVGLSVAVSTLVGQALGRGRPEDGVEATRSALHVTLAYVTVVLGVMVFFPGPLLAIFKSADQAAAAFSAVTSIATVLMRYVAVYGLFGAISVVYVGAIRGAGDTHFAMWAMFGVSIGVMIVPAWVALNWLHVDLYGLWGVAIAYGAAQCAVFWGRFRSGKWKHMRVI